MSIERALVWLLKLGLGLLLLYAGAIKIADPASFAEEVANYRMVPELAPLVAAALPPVEIVVGLVLIFAPAKNAWLPAAALASGLMMLVFLVGVTQVVLRGIDTSCGCFGADSGPVTWLTVGRVLLLAGCSGWLLKLSYMPYLAQSKLASTIASDAS